MVHILGGTYIAFVALLFETIRGILLALGAFLVVFLLLSFFSRSKLFTLLRQLNCRKEEDNHSVLINVLLTLIILSTIFFVFYNYPASFAVACLSIAWGDAAGEFIGKFFPFGKYRIFNQKSFSGSVAVFLFNCLAFLIAPLYCGYSIECSWAWKIMVGALICTLSEAFSWKWLDNLYIPIVASLLMFCFTSF
ncbi:MAG: hypothetical protein GF308_15590 [Candidatus Heimdallarchaeota archaeon]|nr:hypothetical protein [Candidatus Heimdallarchaeota archaeon]